MLRAAACARLLKKRRELGRPVSPFLSGRSHGNFRWLQKPLVGMVREPCCARELQPKSQPLRHVGLSAQRVRSRTGSEPLCALPLRGSTHSTGTWRFALGAGIAASCWSDGCSDRHADARLVESGNDGPATSASHLPRSVRGYDGGS